MEYSPPPLFKQGAPARVKVTVFALLSIALLVVDARFHALDGVRKVASTALLPFKMAALVPRDALTGMGDYFSSISALQKEVRDLKSQQVGMAQTLQQAQLVLTENAHLRRLMDAREHLPVRSIMAEILYDARDPSTRRVVVDRGSRHGVEPGLPVIDNAGVVGQVTRVFPFTSEVTLLTDKEQAIPVQVLRSGLRNVAYGRGQSGLLDLRFVAPNADIQVGDILVTSGLDGMYPAGLAVAKVIQVENVAQGAFGRVVCQPLAGIDRNRQLLIVKSDEPVTPRPAAEPAKNAPGAAPASKKNLPKMAPIATPPLAPQPLPAAAPAAPVNGVQGTGTPSAAHPATPGTPAHTAAAQPPGAGQPASHATATAAAPVRAQGALQPAAAPAARPAATAGNGTPVQTPAAPAHAAVGAAGRSREGA